MLAIFKNEELFFNTKTRMYILYEDNSHTVCIREQADLM